MAKWSGNRDRNTPLRHRALQRAAMIGIRSAISIRARGQWPHPEAVYMTAPRSVCRNTKKALAERGPSIHDGCGPLPPHRQHYHVVGVAEAALQHGILQLIFEPAGGTDAALGGKGAAEHRATVRQPLAVE